MESLFVSMPTLEKRVNRTFNMGRISLVVDLIRGPSPSLPTFQGKGGVGRPMATAWL